MKTSRKHTASSAGFTLVEAMISMFIVTLVMGMTLSTFLFGLRMMYKDSQRLATNNTLRYFMAQVAKTTLDASEFYIYPSYETLDGKVDSQAELTTATTDYYDIDLYHGDCLVLVTRTSLDDGSKIRQVSVYYRTTTEPDKEGAIRYYEGKDYGSAGTDETLDDLLTGINLRDEPKFPGSRELASRALGRVKANATKDDPNTPNDYRYPIFASKAPTISTENESVSINAEVINGTTANNMLSSSSFNYTISPRR